jgi:hypothetical protein
MAKVSGLEVSALLFGVVVGGSERERQRERERERHRERWRREGRGPRLMNQEPSSWFRHQMLEKRTQRRKRDQDLYRPDHALFCSVRGVLNSRQAEM